jgi:hypothetical protein
MIRLSVATVEQLLRWDMSVLEKSPLYEEILKRSFQKGLDEWDKDILEKLPLYQAFSDQLSLREKPESATTVDENP